MPRDIPYFGLFSASNRADWIEDVTVTEQTTGDPVDLSDASITFAVRDKDGWQKLNATIGAGITLLPTDDDNQFRWIFTETQMRALDPGSYDIGLTIEIDDVTTQYMVGELSVYDGVVP